MLGYGWLKVDCKRLLMAWGVGQRALASDWFRPFSLFTFLSIYLSFDPVRHYYLVRLSSGVMDMEGLLLVVSVISRSLVVKETGSRSIWKERNQEIRIDWSWKGRLFYYIPDWRLGGGPWFERSNGGDLPLPPGIGSADCLIGPVVSAGRG